MAKLTLLRKEIEATIPHALGQPYPSTPRGDSIQRTAVLKGRGFKPIVLMTLTLTLTPEIEQYLTQRAQEQGLSTEAYTRQLLIEYILLKQKQAKLVNLLQSWMDEEDAEEQQETGEYLIQALDEDRLSERKLFPIELKGVTW